MALVTFLVAIDVDDLTTLTDLSLDIQDDLERAGFSVESVKPWARPTGNPLTNLPNLVEPPAEPTPPAL